MAILKNPFIKRLKEARLAHDLSQKGLGIAAGIDEFSASTRMNQYETGKHAPDFSMLQRIAKVLKVPVGYFYTQDDLLAEILKIYEQLPASDRKAVLKFVRTIDARRA